MASAQNGFPAKDSNEKCISAILTPWQSFFGRQLARVHSSRFSQIYPDMDLVILAGMTHF